MRLTARLDALAHRLLAPPTVRDDDAPVRAICEMLEQYAPIPAGVISTDIHDRLDGVLDRLSAAGVGIPAGPQTSRIARIGAVYGMSVREFDDALRERAGYGAR